MNAGFIGIDVTVTRLNSTTNVVTSSNPAFPIESGRLTADILVVAGGGGGGTNHAGGGGGGGARLIQGVNIAPLAGGTTP